MEGLNGCSSEPQSRRETRSYEIVDSIGAGGMRDVSTARDAHLGVWCPKISSAQFTDCSEREARAIAALSWSGLTEGRTIQLPCSFSPDGKRLAFLQLSTGGYPEIWTAPVEIGRDGSATLAKLGNRSLF